MIRFHQLSDPASSTYTYLLACPATGNAVLIDSVREQIDRDIEFLRKHGLRLEWILETHVHADHVTGAAALQARTGARTAVGRRAGIACATRLLGEGDAVAFGEESLAVLETPGHTAGCVSYLWNDRVFTGDSLMIGSCGRTDFQDGDPGTLFDSVTRKLFALPDETLVYPAHDYHGRRVSCIAEERETNARFAGRTRAEFVEFMEALQLDPPRQLEFALPANRHCGRIEAL